MAVPPNTSLTVIVSVSLSESPSFFATISKVYVFPPSELVGVHENTPVFEMGILVPTSVDYLSKSNTYIFN